MKIILSTNLVNNIIVRLSKVSNTPILDLALIYKKYSNSNKEPSRIANELFGINKKLTISVFSILPFFLDLIKRMRYYPIAYLTKSKDFYNSEFFIKKGVLIPRPESEILVDLGILFSLSKLIEAKESKTTLIEGSFFMEKFNNFQSQNIIVNQIKNACKEENGFLFVNYESIINLKENIVKKNKIQDIFSKRRSNESSQIEFCEFCTGSGAISISLIKELLSFNKLLCLNKKNDLYINYLNIKPNCLCFDISKKAISIAKKNAKIILGKEVNSIRIIKSNILKECFLKKVKNKMFDFILANPPYISKADFIKLPFEVKRYEPKIALLPPKEQNIFYKKIVYLSSFLLKKYGFLALEVSDNQHAKNVATILKKSDFDTFIVNDFQGIGRVVAGQKI